MITVTPEAAQEVARRLLGQAETVGMRIFVRGMG